MKITAIKAMTAGVLLGISTLTNAADFSAVPSGDYALDPSHAYITFSYNHLGLSNPILSFDDFTVDLNLDNADPTKSTINVTIDANSISAGSDEWLGHISGPKYFDVSNHPEITFASTSIEAARDGNYKVMGDLTIKGESKPVSLEVVINAAINHPMSGNPTIGLAATSTVMRSEFGMDTAVPHVSDEVALNIAAELIKTK